MKAAGLSVLVVDDEGPVRKLLTRELGRKGFQADSVENGDHALQRLKASSYDIVLLDIVMPGMDGISLLKKIKADPASPAVIILTGKATVDTAVEAMKNGAFDYLSKPYKLEELIIVINRASEQRRLRIENEVMQRELARRESSAVFIGRSAVFRRVVATIEKIAPTDSTVLVTGESGTGKELAAQAIWSRSRRKDRPMIPLNCASFSESLIESELFGHEKGAFTSAYSVKRGLVESAHEGTLFLDEIAELPLSIQASLLRFLDSGEFRRVGGNKALSADVRLIAATNRNLEGLVRRNAFREDLFYRLNVISIDLPPLRERREDIKPLAEHFLEKYRLEVGRQVSGFGPGLLDLLTGYDWPGNVRELENVIERAVILCEGNVLTAKDIALPSPVSDPGTAGVSQLQDMEKEHILKALEQTGGNQSRASRLLGIDRKTLYLKIRKYGIDPGS